MTTILVPFQFNLGSLATTDDPHQVARQEIIDVLMTDNYERVMNHTYGANTSELLFEGLDRLVIADYKEETLAMLNAHMSNCSVTDLTVTNSPPDGAGSGPGEVGTNMYVNAYYRLHGDVTAASVSVSIVDPATINASTPL